MLVVLVVLLLVLVVLVVWVLVVFMVLMSVVLVVAVAVAVGVVLLVFFVVVAALVWLFWVRPGRVIRGRDPYTLTKSCCPAKPLRPDAEAWAGGCSEDDKAPQRTFHLALLLLE